MTSPAKKIGVFNAFGDEKTDADVYAEQVCIDHFKKTEVIQAYMSKESANVTFKRLTVEVCRDQS